MPAPNGGTAAADAAPQVPAPTTTDAPYSRPRKRRRLERLLNFCAGNIKGTDQYYGALLRKWRATSLYHSFMNDKEATFFHTTSIAEFYDPYLRHLLAAYVGVISGGDAAERIKTNDSAFHKAQSKYKHITTHFFAFKWETWLHSYLRPVLGVTDVTSKKEFAKSRGAIHVHSLLYTESPVDTLLTRALHGYSEKLYHAIEDVMQVLDGIEDSSGAKPASVFDESNCQYDGCWKRIEAYMCESDAGLAGWDVYRKRLEAIDKEATATISKIMTEEYGYSALHPGMYPNEWLEPAGQPRAGYDKSVNRAMMTRKEVTERAELREFKFQRERHLYSRRVNITNHVQLHSCSDYCWRARSIDVPFNPSNHCEGGGDKLKDHIIRKYEKRDREGNLVQRVKVRVCECRMGFGNKLEYPRDSKKQEYTGGKDFNPCNRITWDPNGVPRFEGARNHPRICQQPLPILHWGANADLQRFLCHSGGYENHPSGRESEQFQRAMFSLNRQGLIRAWGSEQCQFYCTGYCCKGHNSSQQWSKEFDKLVEYFCQSHGMSGSPTSLKRLVGSFCRSIVAKRDVPKDEAVFSLTGGSESMNTMEVRGCSINSIRTRDIAATADDPSSTRAPKKVFTFPALVRAYKEKDPKYNDMSLYQYAAQVYVGSKNNHIVPNFFGYEDRPSWPVEESFAKSMLTLYHPWLYSVDELADLDGNFVPKFLEFMHDTKRFPQRITAKIMQKKLRWKPELIEEHAVAGQAAQQSTPTSQHSENLQDMAAFALHQSPDEYDDAADADLLDEELDSLPNPDPSYDWNARYKDGAETWLQEYTQKYYQDRTANTLNGIESELKLFPPLNIHHPRNAKGFAQKLVIGIALLQLRRWCWFQERLRNGDVDAEPPESIPLYVQGNPGSGKTYCQKTCLNCIRLVLQSTKHDQPIAPTGCAASLLNGTTSFRMASLPTGKKAHKPPSDDGLPKNVDTLQAHILAFCLLVFLFKDEHSMDARHDWAWLRHRIERARDPANGLDKTFAIADSDGVLPNQVNTTNSFDASVGGTFAGKISKVHKQMGIPVLGKRPFGGIPLLASFGDCQQLPPVCARSHFDKTAPNHDGNQACRQGMLAFNDFIDPDHPRCHGVTVVMDHVERQSSDPEFGKVLQRTREGTLDHKDAEYYMSRLLSNLPPEEKKLFEDNALFLLPTWKRTRPITIKYLRGLNKPIAKIRAHVKAGKTSHVSQELNLPARSALCEGAKVMLLKNYVVEHNLKNGSIGTLKYVVYPTSEGPMYSDQSDPTMSLPLYAVVEFEKSTIPTDEAWDPANPKLVPIPLTTIRCEKNCCSMTTLPLRVCKAITTYKSQGLSVGQGQEWEYVVVGIPGPGEKSAPGQELVGFSRATEFERLAIYDDEPVTKESFIKIGRSEGCKKKRAFEAELCSRQASTQARVIAAIKEQSTCDVSESTFDTGYNALVDWFQTTIIANGGITHFDAEEQVAAAAREADEAAGTQSSGGSP